MKQNYREGEFVRAGQVLFEIDPRTFQATVDGAKGALASGSALGHGQANLARVRPLAEKNAVSQKDLDDNIGYELSTRAAVASAQAQAGGGTTEPGLHPDHLPVPASPAIAKAQVGNLVGPGQIQS